MWLALAQITARESLDDEGAKMMADRGTWLVPTLYCFQHDLQTGLSKGREPSSMAKGIAIVKELRLDQRYDYKSASISAVAA